MKQLTRDHNYGSLTEDRDVNFFPEKPMADDQLLTGAIGGNDVLALEHSWFGLQQRDEFLICTDGLYKELIDEKIREVLIGSGTMESRVGKLAELYNLGGARDNIAMVLIGKA